MTTAEFIQEYREKDTRQLALRSARFPRCGHALRTRPDKRLADSAPQAPHMGSLRRHRLPATPLYGAVLVGADGAV